MTETGFPVISNRSARSELFAFGRQGEAGFGREVFE